MTHDTRHRQERFTARIAGLAARARAAGAVTAVGLVLVLAMAANPALTAGSGSGPGAAELTAQEILDKASNRVTIAQSGIATVRMTTVDKKGTGHENVIVIYRKESGSTKNQLIEFLKPADVKGTKLLSKTDSAGAVEMWLYMPALGRERRISGTATRESFMGTDFSYEDISGGFSYSSEFTAVRKPDAQFENRFDCYVLELTPRSKASDFGRVVVWIWKEQLIPVRSEFYDLKNRLTKVLSLGDFRKSASGNMMPWSITMENRGRETTTIIEILEAKEGTVKDDYFTMRYLRS